MVAALRSCGVHGGVLHETLPACIDKLAPLTAAEFGLPKLAVTLSSLEPSCKPNTEGQFG